MAGNILLLLPVVFPIVMGIIVFTGKGFRKNRRKLCTAVAFGLAGSWLLTLIALISGGEGLLLWSLTDSVEIAFRVDEISRLFAGLTATVWLLVGIYSFSYMTHEEREHEFFGCFLIVLGVLVALDFSANLITFYLFYEAMTLTSLPLVLHERTKEAVMAGLKYLFYSVAGAFLALFGIFFLTVAAGDLSFIPGGVLTAEMTAGREGIFLAALCCMLIGFGTKAGMFPLHGWLPTAHPVAPAPASAVLSGVITKSGVLGIIRVVYYIVGPDLLRGTWVQTVWMVLTLITVFMGSMLAYKEPVLKKRLAYSTVSQVSYVLFGLSLLEPTAYVGALSHVIFHSLVKNALFLSAGAVIFHTGWTRVEQMKGLGQIMPRMLACYTLVSLTLVGIPPTSGFISKWYLAQGALASGTEVFCWLGPVILLISALLTAGYLLPLTIQGFFPGTVTDASVLKDERTRKEERSPEEEKSRGREPSWLMLAPVILLTAGAVLFGCFPGPLLSWLQTAAKLVLG